MPCKLARDSLRADEQARESIDRLYDSRLQEIRLTREVRNQGYGDVVRDLVQEALKLDTTRMNKDELLCQLVLSMGDFVAFPPRSYSPRRGILPL